MLHFVTSYMKQNKNRKQTLESAQYGLEISFKFISPEVFFPLSKGACRPQMTYFEGKKPKNRPVCKNAVTNTFSMGVARF